MYVVPRDTLSVSGKYLNIEAENNSTATFNITSNTNWYINSNQTWVTPGFKSGSENATITLTALSNPTIAARTAKVVVSGTGVPNDTVFITQAAGKPTLSFQKIL